MKVATNDSALWYGTLLAMLRKAASLSEQGDPRHRSRDEAWQLHNAAGLPRRACRKHCAYDISRHE
jgi:hypothetical protein